MGIRGAALGHVELAHVTVPLSARLGEDIAEADHATNYSEAIALSRLGWAALAVGTSHAVLDYVIPYVKEPRGVRRAHRPSPIGRVHVRQHRD